MISYKDCKGPLTLAHRGGGGEAPENSLKAFSRAVQLGFKHLETDVHLGSDGKLYLYHGSFTLFPGRLIKPSASLTTLEELFQTFPDTYISIDPKHEPAAEPLVDMIVKYGMTDKVCIVSPADDSRSERIAQRIHELTGKRPCTALSSVRATMHFLTGGKGLGQDARRVQASIIDVHRTLITPRRIERAHQQNLRVIAWTVNDKATMHKFLEWGIDGFMTDFPTVAKRFIA